MVPGAISTYGAMPEGKYYCGLQRMASYASILVPWPRIKTLHGSILHTKTLSADWLQGYVLDTGKHLGKVPST
jgi:hypothetical protein